MRILHVTPWDAEAWGYGGVPRVVAAQVAGLRALGHEVTVCATDARDGRQRLPRSGGPGPRFRAWPAGYAGGIERRVFPNLSNRLAYRFQLPLPIGLRRYLAGAAGSFDVAHVHACHHLPGVLAARALARARVAFVLQPNGTAPRIERRQAAKWLFDHLLDPGALRRPRRIVAVSEAERLGLIALGVAAERIRVVPNPVEAIETDESAGAGAGPGLPLPDLRGKLGIAAGAEVILFLGRLTPRKRADLVIDAFARLARPGARLVIAGNDGGEERRLRAQAQRLGVSASTSFPGLFEGADRIALLAAADVVVAPGRDEAFGLVAVEALLAGRPVVVADDAGSGEVLRATGGGRVVPEGDASAVAAAIRELLADKPAARVEAALGGERVRARYATGRVVERLVEVYRETIGAGG